MTLAELGECIVELRLANSDLTHVEVKAAASELPKRLWETLSAFSNTTKGGVLILGISEESKFKIDGVKNPKKLLQDLASMCDVMNPPVRAYIQIHRIEQKTVITAEIPEIPASAKPCYHPGAGLTNGAFVRVADGDRKLSSYEVQMMLAARGQPTDDEEPVPGTSVADLQAQLIKGLLSRLRKRPGSVFSRLSDDAILRTLKVLVPAGKKWVCSLGGILALGKYPQRFFPALGLTFVVFPASEVGQPGPSLERFLDNERIEGTISDMLRPTLDILRRNMKHRSIVKGLYREDTEEYPATAVREAIINALAHRDLSSGSRGTPVQIHMFPDRLVIHNPGGLYGPVTVDSLGREGISATRNNMLLRLLEDVAPTGEQQAVCENRGSGVGAMLAALRQARLPDPVFENRIATFRVTFLNTPERRRRDRRADILQLLRNRGALSRAEISQALSLSDISIRKWLATMRKEKVVVITGQKARSKNVRYEAARG
ncbi:MAG TPA: ATP-binding protein [Bryobacteraceae bacterium]|nr:ATP-binding protein [Bryobacteraceae bacterium]